MTSKERTSPLRSVLLASAAAVALVVAPAAIDAVSGSGMDTAQAAQGEGQGKQMRGGQGGGAGQGQGGMQKGGQEGTGGGSGSRLEEDVMRGQHGRDEGASAADEDEDSDRPDWAGRDATGDKPGGGNQGGSTQKGGLYGDLWVIVRNDNGEPILYVWDDRDNDGELEPYEDENGFPQPVAADGSLIPLDEEGHPIDESLTQEVELGRLNIGRSPTKVTDRALGEALDVLNAATDVDTDAAGRLMVLVDGEWKTIDSPVENLALYIDLIQDGTIDGLDNSIVSASFANLTDGQLTDADYSYAATFLAAAADKTGTVTLDEVIYMNNILGLNGVEAGDYLDLTSVSYTRSSVYDGVTAEVLVDPDGDGTWETMTVDIYDAVFNSIDETASAAAGFAQAVDDARAVVNFVHEYEVPADSLEDVSH